MRLLEQGLSAGQGSRNQQGQRQSRFYSRGFLEEYCRLEVARAGRYCEEFSIVLLRLEAAGGSFSAEGLSKRGLAALLRQLVGNILGSLRDCDVAGFIKDRRILLVLPRTDYLGTLVVKDKVRSALKAWGGRLSFSVCAAGATYPRDGLSYGELLACAEARLDEAENSVVHRLGLEGKLFWQMVASLTSGEHKGHDTRVFDPTAIAPDRIDGRGLVDAINSTIIAHIKSFPHTRGVLYIAGDRVVNRGWLKEELGSAAGCATRIFLLGADAPKPCENVTALALADPRLADAAITLMVTECGSYGLIATKTWQEGISLFHTAEDYLVETLVRALQQEYSLSRTFA